ncbi:tRNA uridine(34) 5-carboxymethylaminomethyl modification radical SAM/GNAT enzyme Elp3 [Candidatus Peregrinibacteria bacterium CG11_big_fil_rev_8_21_14_0_20_46_8]|nr:MAG: tRNA uridine(34) 5-carboxymethylaminomethyl modification radical SAM/GNAT enzyme Elp3 [Candidatus Peregrinibacteria bacterium CG11_big_fil_rev_8_21_14_0_20_46_8]
MAAIANLVLDALESGIKTPRQLHRLKLQFAEHFGISPPPNSELISAYRALIKTGRIKDNPEFRRLIQKRSIRTLSGVSPVAILTKPFGCPARCVFCPTEQNVPKSYLSNEPAVMRAIINEYDPERQVSTRLKALHANGHPTDKIEMIVMGGTWSAHPEDYKYEYISGIFEGLNKSEKLNKKSVQDIQVEDRRNHLQQLQKINETADSRCVALTLETRPDWINEKEIHQMRELGCTRVEIGVQSLYDDVLEIVKRGHGTAEARQATQLLKDAGFKVSYHMMPNLPGSTVEKDIEMFKELFDNPAYRPDMMKFYPCMVVPFSELKLWYEQGKHRPYTDEELIQIIFAVKPMFPRYLRVTRLIRDIPATSIIGGSHTSNLRQVAHKMMKEQGIVCNCIRCREIRDEVIDPKNIELRTLEYDASEGKEFFLSYDDASRDKLCALLRLRFSSYSLKGTPHFIKELEGAALLRELHTYGAQVPISERDELASQHMGFGKKLVAEAENIARKHGYKKMAVISGVGIREYYRKQGYELEGTYMTKLL